MHHHVISARNRENLGKTANNDFIRRATHYSGGRYNFLLYYVKRENKLDKFTGFYHIFEFVTQYSYFNSHKNDIFRSFRVLVHTQKLLNAKKMLVKYFLEIPTYCE